MKKNIKKIVFLLIASICISAVIGCGSGNNATQSVKLPDDDIAAEAMQQPKREVNEAELIPLDDIIAENGAHDADGEDITMFVMTDNEIDKPFTDAMGGDESLNNYQTFVNFGMRIAPEGIDTYSSKAENAGSLSRLFTNGSIDQRYSVLMTDIFSTLLYNYVPKDSDAEEYLPYIEEFVRQSSNIELEGSEYWSKVSERAKSGDVRYPIMITVSENDMTASSIQIMIEQNGFSVAANYKNER